MPTKHSGTRLLHVHGYIPGLDVLRGLAVGAVVLFHAFLDGGYAGTNRAATTFVALTNLGKLGVYLFFTLSGFLITTILLKQRERPGFYRNFYIRRALRILPAYLLLLVVLKAFGLVHWPFVLACLLFIANMAKLLHSSANEYGVLWTLAVEEQFYLLWPTVVHQLRRPRALLTVVLVGCALAPLLRIALSLRGIGTYLLLPTNMDALLYGALCALLIGTGAIHRENIGRIRRILLAVGSVFLLPYVSLFDFPITHGPVFWALFDGFGRLDPYCFFVAGVLLSVENAQSEVPAVRRSPVARFLVFLGYISYGLYLVHPLMFHLYDRLFAGTLLGESRTRFSILVLRCLLASLVSILVATVSRRYYEQLFLGRKKLLAPYAGATTATESLP